MMSFVHPKGVASGEKGGEQTGVGPGIPDIPTQQNQMPKQDSPSWETGGVRQDGPFFMWVRGRPRSGHKFKTGHITPNETPMRTELHHKCDIMTVHCGLQMGSRSIPSESVLVEVKYGTKIELCDRLLAETFKENSD